MLEYTLQEAKDLLETKLSSAQNSLNNILEDLEFLREQITTMEVSILFFLDIIKFTPRNRHYYPDKFIQIYSCYSLIHNLFLQILHEFTTGMSNKGGLKDKQRLVNIFQKNFSFLLFFNSCNFLVFAFSCEIILFYLIKLVRLHY